MTLVGNSTRYGAAARVFHWATAVLVVAAFTLGPGGSEERVYSAAKDFDRQVHETLGLAIFAIVIARLLWRAFDRAPEAPPAPAWMKGASRLVHGILYALLFALPLTAISGAWLEGHPLTLLAGVKIAPWLSAKPDLGRTIASIHTWLGDAILWLAGLHAVAALYHHFVLRDRVLASMVPGVNPPAA